MKAVHNTEIKKIQKKTNITVYKMQYIFLIDVLRTRNIMFVFLSKYIQMVKN